MTTDDTIPTADLMALHEQLMDCAIPMIDCGHFRFIGEHAQETYDALLRDLRQPLETLDGPIQTGLTPRRGQHFYPRG